MSRVSGQAAFSEGASNFLTLHIYCCIMPRIFTFGAGKTSGGNVLKDGGRSDVALVQRTLSLNFGELKEQFAMVGLPGHLLC